MLLLIKTLFPLHAVNMWSVWIMTANLWDSTLGKCRHRDGWVPLLLVGFNF